MSNCSALRGTLPCLLALGLLGPFQLLAAARPKAAPVQQRTPVLKAGDPAPAFTVGRWLKGTPVTAFQPGHVYEGKVTFIGVNVWEKGKGR